MKTYRLVPDGGLLDRAGEFIFADKDRIRVLFNSDPLGYLDAVAKFVQAVASSEKLVTGERPQTFETTDRLREHLIRAGKHEYSEFFAPQAVAIRRAAAYQWLKNNWSDICLELTNADSPAGEALLGHVQREFFCYGIPQDLSLQPFWFSPEAENLKVPAEFLQRSLRSIRGLGVASTLSSEQARIRSWIEQVVTTHYRIFGEYWLFLGKETGDEYLPAFARSSLEFLSVPSPRTSVEKLVTPFVGFAALESLTNRADLLETAIEWREGKGKDIVSGVEELQTIFRMKHDTADRDKLLKEVETVLTSRIPYGLSIVFNGVKLVTEAIARRADTAAAENLVTLSQSYRWLWRIRQPDLQRQWHNKMRQLLL